MTWKSCGSYFQTMQVLFRATSLSSSFKHKHVMINVINDMSDCFIKGNPKAEFTQTTEMDRLAFAAHRKLIQSCETMGHERQRICRYEALHNGAVSFLSSISSPVDEVSLTAFELLLFSCSSSPYRSKRSLLNIFKTIQTFISGQDCAGEYIDRSWQLVFEMCDCQISDFHLTKAILELAASILLVCIPCTETLTKYTRMLTNLMESPAWETCDVALEQLTRVFQNIPGIHDHLTNTTLLNAVFACMKHDSAFVRASALKCVESALEAEVLHQIIKNDSSVMAQIVDACVLDSEAFVKRAGLALVGCLCKKEKEYTKVLFSSDEEASKCLTKRSLSQLCRDEDLEVRVQVVELLGILCCSSLIEIDEPFLFVDGDRHFMALVDDSARLVRAKALQWIPQMKRALTTSTPNPRLVALESSIDGMDLEYLACRCEPEFLYQEILDMDDSLFTESDDAGQINNVLNCYDC